MKGWVSRHVQSGVAPNNNDEIVGSLDEGMRT